MSTWQGAWFLAKEELRRIRWRHIVTIVFVGYLLLFLTTMFSQALAAEANGVAYWSMDFLMMGLLPIFGLMSTQSAGIYWKTDSYTKKLTAWRTLPIPLRQLSLGRLLLFLVNGLPPKLLFFILFYFGITSMNEDVTLGTYILFALFWLSYSIITGMVYIYVEMGYSGKVYMWFCAILSFGMLFALLLHAVWTKNSLMVIVYEVCAGGPWLTLIAAAIALLAVWRGVLLLERRVKKRDLSR